MQSDPHIRGALKQWVNRLIVQYRIERMARRLAWIGAITSISCVILSIAYPIATHRANW